MTNKYTVICEKDEATKVWMASVDEVPGCHTQASEIRDIEPRIREALSLFINDENPDLIFVFY